MLMEYFRRPQLVGKNLARVSSGVVRGSIRRKDADNTSSVPYFENVAAGQTLSILTDQGAATATLTGAGLQTILDDLNSTFNVLAAAREDDGVISIQAGTLGALGYVEITGGTAAAALGFNTKAGVHLRSAGGDLPSSPENRVGNWFGVAMPGKGEAFRMEAIQRIAGRLSANTDVLFSEHARSAAMLQKAGRFTSSTAIAGTTAGYLALDPSLRVYNGLGSLSRTSSRRDLAPFFLIIDSVTKEPAASQVIGVVKGSPTSKTPANTTSWAANDGGSVLGLDLVKATHSITSILNGKVVYAPGANFVSMGCVAGDFATIADATNTDEWGNNGYKWVVEEVIDEDHVSLRPMSSSELALVGTALTEEQPVLELNGNVSGGQVLGTISVSTGAFTSSVSLIVSPPFPSGAAYDVWVCQPTSLRQQKPGEAAAAQAGAHLPFANNDTRLIPDGILSGFSQSNTSTTLSIANGHFRWCGRHAYVPGYSRAFSGSDTAGDYYFSVDGELAAISSTTLPSGIFTLNPGLYPVCKIHWDGSTLSGLTDLKRMLDPGLPSVVTVGIDGQFDTLKPALDYLSAAASANGETPALGAYCHAEVVLTSDAIIDSAITLTAPGVRIRGANPMTRIVISGNLGGPAITAHSGPLFLEDLYVSNSAANKNVFVDGVSVAMKNVRHDLTNAFTWVVNHAWAVGYSAPKFEMQDCEFAYSYGVIAAFAPIRTSNSHFVFTYDASVTSAPQAFAKFTSDTTAARTNDTEVLSCTFDNLGTENAGTVPYLVNSEGRLALKGNVFNFKTISTYNTGVMAASAGPATVDANYAPSGTGRFCGAFFQGSNQSSVTNNTLLCLWASSAVGAIRCGYAAGNYLVGANVGSTTGPLLEVYSAAVGNHLEGTLYAGIKADAGAAVSGNYVVNTGGITCTAGIQTTTSNEVTGNQVSSNSISVLIGTSDIRLFGNLLSGRVVASGNCSHVYLASNHISAAPSTAQGVIAFGGSCAYAWLNGNYVQSTTSDARVLQFQSVPTNITIAENALLMPEALGAAISGGAVGTMTGNYVRGSILSQTPATAFEGNYVSGTVSLKTNLCVGNYVGALGYLSDSLSITPSQTGEVALVQGNYVVGSTQFSSACLVIGNSLVGAADDTHVFGSGRFSGNRVVGLFSSTSATNYGSEDVGIDGNSFVGDVDVRGLYYTHDYTQPEGRVHFNSNSVNGAFTVRGRNTSVADNVFVGTVTFMADVECLASGNRYYNDVSYAGGTGYLILSESYLARKFENTAVITGRLRFAGNLVELTQTAVGSAGPSTDPRMKIYGCTGRVQIEGNVFKTVWGATTDHLPNTIVLGASNAQDVNDVSVQNNTLEASGATSPAATVALVELLGKVTRLFVVGNRIDHASGANYYAVHSDAGATITSLLLSANMVSTAGTVGGTSAHQGGAVYQASGAYNLQ